MPVRVMKRLIVARRDSPSAGGRADTWTRPLRQSAAIIGMAPPWAAIPSRDTQRGRGISDSITWACGTEFHPEKKKPREPFGSPGLLSAARFVVSLRARETLDVARLNRHVRHGDGAKRRNSAAKRCLIRRIVTTPGHERCSGVSTVNGIHVQSRRRLQRSMSKCTTRRRKVKFGRVFTVRGGNGSEI
jgi:hypothetical protein